MTGPGGEDAATVGWPRLRVEIAIDGDTLVDPLVKASYAVGPLTGRIVAQLDGSVAARELVRRIATSSGAAPAMVEAELRQLMPWKRGLGRSARARRIRRAT